MLPWPGIDVTKTRRAAMPARRSRR